MDSIDVQRTLKDMWDTRPSRPRDGRQVAGVATGIARRYDIDPTLVRIAFVVAAVTGVGAALYAAGWVVLPEERVAPGQPVPPAPRGLALIGFAIALAITVGWIFGGGGSIFLPLVASAVLLFLLHRSRGDRGLRGAPGPFGDQMSRFGSELGTQFTGSFGCHGHGKKADEAESTGTAPTGTGPTVNLSKEPGIGSTETAAQQAAAAPPYPYPEPGRTPPAWDPLGAAPFAWDLPDPGTPEPEPAPVRRRKAPVTAVTLGLALLATGATAAILLLTGQLMLASGPLLLGVALGTIGLGLVVGAFLRAGRGLIPFAIVLGLLTWGALSAPLDRLQGNGFGDVTVRPASLAEMQPRYVTGAGDVTLDLRGIDFTAVGTNTGPVTLAAQTGAGDVTITVPPDTDVTFTGKAGFGSVVAPGNRKSEGGGAQLRIVDDLGRDQVASGRPLVIDAETGLGEVEVRRG